METNATDELLSLPNPRVGWDDLPRIEERLESIRTRTNRTLLPHPFRLYPVVIVDRVVAICLGVSELVQLGLVAGAAAALRPAVEGLILAAWLAMDEDPWPRTKRWHGESERNVRTMVRESGAAAAPDRFRRLADAVSDQRSADREEAVAAGKAAATEAGQKKSMMPSVETMADECGLGVFSWEAYQVAYRFLSAWEHFEHGTFSETVTEDEAWIEDAPFDPTELRALAASVAAAAIVVAAAAAGDEDLVAEANGVRSAILA